MRSFCKKAFDGIKLASMQVSDEVDLDVFTSINIATGQEVEIGLKEKGLKRLESKYHTLYGCPEYCLAVWYEEVV